MKAKKKRRSNRVASDVLLGGSLTRYEQLPKRAKVNEGTAWWYAMRDGIELHIAKGSGHSHYVVRLPLAKLQDYVLRMTHNAEVSRDAN